MAPEPSASSSCPSDSSSDTQELNSASLWCLAILDPISGAAVRRATPEEARQVAAQLRRRQDAYSDSEPREPEYACQTSPLCRQGGPCRHCGASGTAPSNLARVFRPCGGRFQGAQRVSEASWQPSQASGVAGVAGIAFRSCRRSCDVPCLQGV